MNIKLNPRKIPQQKRSKERYQKIIDTTIGLLGEVGYDDLTTDLIAERSGIPVGSIYQFFPNKESIIYSHAESCYFMLHDFFFKLLDEELKKRKKFTPEFIDFTLHSFERTLNEVKGYRLINSILYTNQALLKLDIESNERFAKSLAEKVILYLFPKVDKKRAYYSSLMIVETVDSVVKIAQRKGKPAEKKALLSELQNLLFVYFSSFL
ncbi:TetR/AcrR family transcriptional regulator [Leptospira sp. 2 VSF19]|uniref:TetR/AcrR family transcriptional regulator n=1 Tax=Leptospira soteropolitanensis TaxID=2950025 RepID=A0AAW5VC58_9LEPT|nr:TetR/AcrR family transcriptional regulator [Leptospira soteropolitanensis]MCW7491134.1 TetR/AcrR family transcriptional regulator [Leptospira soteropolitanensis]MCW7498718.1 TetR/AcrR family transcriptional regulator [Leptospira soteropolitanensis]MCW7521689.1 TetR/AcrR family transcriptional regulator [Leptospira soteropolitanensis]MCW7524822.1 TetR/AcrR family transcriptional regulator [Leptospira soteropolitanensis]MCW7528689.1 TetR/AcrR family transcriptional regulator [Leptospira soter